MSEPDPNKELYSITAKLPLSTYLSFVHATYPRVDHILGGLAARKKNAGSETQLLQALRQAKAEALREAIEDWLAKQKREQGTHDGDLGHNTTVWYEDDPYITDDGERFYVPSVMLSDKMRHMALIPKEALSLLEWLKQEEPTLRRMEKEKDYESGRE